MVLGRHSDVEVMTRAIGARQMPPLAGARIEPPTCYVSATGSSRRRDGVPQGTAVRAAPPRERARNSTPRISRRSQRGADALAGPYATCARSIDPLVAERFERARCGLRQAFAPGAVVDERAAYLVDARVTPVLFQGSASPPLLPQCRAASARRRRPLFRPEDLYVALSALRVPWLRQTLFRGIPFDLTETTTSK